MKNFILGILFCLGLTVLATVSIGDKITANKFNNSTFQVGDIKHSLLSESDFQTKHGDCWIQYNQGTDNSDIDITGTDLESFTGNVLHSASGRVLRAKGDSSALLTERQEDATAVNGLSGTTSTDGQHQHDFAFERDSSVGVGVPPYQYLGSSGVNVLEVREGSDRTVVNSIRPAGNHNHNLNITSNDSETRMKNLTVNLFLKVNDICN